MSKHLFNAVMSKHLFNAVTLKHLLMVSHQNTCLMLSCQNTCLMLSYLNIYLHKRFQYFEHICIKTSFLTVVCHCKRLPGPLTQLLLSENDGRYCAMPSSPLASPLAGSCVAGLLCKRMRARSLLLREALYISSTL